MSLSTFLHQSTPIASPCARRAARGAMFRAQNRTLIQFTQKCPTPPHPTRPPHPRVSAGKGGETLLQRKRRDTRREPRFFSRRLGRREEGLPLARATSPALGGVKSGFRMREGNCWTFFFFFSDREGVNVWCIRNGRRVRR